MHCLKTYPRTRLKIYVLSWTWPDIFSTSITEIIRLCTINTRYLWRSNTCAHSVDFVLIRSLNASLRYAANKNSTILRPSWAGKDDLAKPLHIHVTIFFYKLHRRLPCSIKNVRKRLLTFIPGIPTV